MMRLFILSTGVMVGMCVRQETISRLETGKHSPGLKTMAKIDRALKRVGV